MNVPRSFLSFGAALLVAAVFSVTPATSFACGDKNECACGAACPNKQMGSCAEAGGCADAEKKAGACACSGAAAPDTKGDAAKPQGGCQGEPHAGGAEGAAHQRAVIDPATGQLTQPSAAEAAAAAPAAGGIPRAVNSPAAQVAQPGGGVQAAFPMDRASNAVAKLDGQGAAAVNCSE